MKIGIAGHGKMGHAVEQIAISRGHSCEILGTRDRLFLPADHPDCVIDFTHAAVAPSLIRMCIDKDIPVVSGTTGWDEELRLIRTYCLEKGGAFLWAPNFSIGMHIVFELNKALARLMNAQPAYAVEILETHHTAKKDAPSGTAIALANQIVDILDRKTAWHLKENGTDNEESLAITAERLEDVKGIHRVTYTGPYDIISIRHKALSRDSFASGAVIAAEWLMGKKGVFRFEDVMA